MTRANPYAPYSSKREQRIVFFFVAVGIMALTYGTFFVFDFLPETPATSERQSTVKSVDTVDDAGELSDTQEIVGADEESISLSQDRDAGTVINTRDENALPVSIIFDTLDGRKVTVLNPKSATVEALDAALLSGVIRHPDSADFAHTGTIFLLGHSSYLPNVMNKNFQAFNGIQKLAWGDTIRLRSNDTEYVYSVDRVYQAKASNSEIPLQYDVAKLVLATCNSFASKDDRFIVEATLVGSHKLSFIGE